jgi:iron(III) transport system ATP-binding protein
MSPAIALRAVDKAYPGGPRAVDGVTLEVAEGTLLALLGPSGCGKTTTLRLIAGLERPDAGDVWVGGRLVAGAGGWAPPEQRRVGLVFQDGALFPHLTVAENIAFALGGRPRAAQAARAADMLALVGLRGLEGRYPHQLSGGQQQRVALARALAPEPAVVLLDEPFANLDVALRVELREEVARILRAAGATAVLVTHDRQEALSLADHVALMLDGRLAQHGTPRELYGRPASRAVAGFVGEANWLPGHAAGGCADSALGPLPLLSPASGPVELLIRPEQLAVRPDPDALWTVGAVRYFGHDQLATLLRDGQPALQARLSATAQAEPGAQVAIAVRGPVSAFPAEGSSH